MTKPAPIARLGGDPPSPWEELYGYSRVVVADPFVTIGGTTSVDEHGMVIGETPYEQAAAIFRKLLHELSRVSLGVADVVQTRMYVTDISRSEEVGHAHAEVFGSAPPATSMVEVSALIDPRMLVEVELVACRASSA